MIVSIHQPAYLPWLGFLDRMRKSDVFIILDTVPFEKGSFINRNKIRNHSEQGWQWLTIPLVRNYQTGTPIREREIQPFSGWAERHWRAIRQEYSRAPHAGRFMDWMNLQLSFVTRTYSLMEVVDSLTEALAGILLTRRPATFRAWQMRATGQKSELILNLCLEVGATTYLSGPLGRNYLDETAFREAGIEVEYHDYVHPIYPQHHGGFIPNMSAIDYLFNVGGPLP